MFVSLFVEGSVVDMYVGVFVCMYVKRGSCMFVCVYVWKGQSL